MNGVRVLTTNDFVGSFFAQPTSYGQLPGAAALQATVDDLRTQAGGAFWIDTGDLAPRSRSVVYCMARAARSRLDAIP